MYGAATEMVITLGQKSNIVNRFQLDVSIGEFMLIEHVRIPEGGGKKIYSCNEGNSKHWDEAIKEAVAGWKESGR